jgi:hypothetical protein
VPRARRRWIVLQGMGFGTGRTSPYALPDTYQMETRELAPPGFFIVTV